MKKFLMLLALITFSFVCLAQDPAPVVEPKTWIEKLLSFDFVGLFILVSAALSLIVAICNWVAKQFNNPTAGKVSNTIGKIIAFLSKVIEFINKPSVPSK